MRLEAYDNGDSLRGKKKSQIQNEVWHLGRDPVSEAIGKVLFGAESGSVIISPPPPHKGKEKNKHREREFGFVSVKTLRRQQQSKTE